MTRMRKRLGVNKFSDVTETGEPDKDYLEPFSGLKGIKNTLSVYLMKSVLCAAYVAAVCITFEKLFFICPIAIA